MASDSDQDTHDLQSSEISENEVIDDTPPSKPVKQKRQMTAKQLENLAKAREKANKVLKEKRARTSSLRAQEKKLKELQLKEKEQRIQEQLNMYTKNVDINGNPENDEIKYVRKSVKKKKEPKIVYYSSSSDDDSEPEIIYKRKPRKYKNKVVHHHSAPPPPAPAPAPPPPPPAPAPAPVQNPDDAAIKEQYRLKVEAMRRKYLVDTMFPTG